MELIELVLNNFKKFTDGRFRFCPGITLIWGPNESGKSTIHEAIACALFGRERGKTVENWNGGLCSIELTYASEGKQFRIERKLSQGVSTMGTLTDEGLIDVISDKDDIAGAVAEHLGIPSKAVFDNTVFIRQMDVSRLSASDMEVVGDEIERVLTGTAHVSAGEVLKRLETKRDTVKGRARPSNPREYDIITDQLSKTAEELADTRRSREQIRNLEDELVGLEDRIGQDSERAIALDALLDRHRRWSDLKKRETEVDGLHASVFSTVKNLKNTLADLTSVQQELVNYADFVGKDSEIADHLTKIENRRTELQDRLGELKSVEDASSSAKNGLVSAVLPGLAVLFAIAGVALGILVSRNNFFLLIPAVVCGAAYLVTRSAGPISELKHLMGLSNSARSELIQLDADEQSILTYVNCQDTSRAWARINAYRRLVSRLHELEVAFSTILGGRSINDWETQEADFDRELSGIRRELADDFNGYAPATEESESWRSESAAIQLSLPRAQARFHGVNGSLDTERKNARDLATLEGEIEFLHRRKDELDSLYKAYEEAISALSAVTKTISEEYLPELCERTTEHMGRITSGRYSSVNIKSGAKVSIDCRDKSDVSVSALSIGTMDQLYLSLRLACGELLSAGRRLPIILDDPFASFDRGRVDSVLNLLERLASENQVLLFTHDPYILDWARSLAESKRVPCIVHDLSN